MNIIKIALKLMKTNARIPFNFLIYLAFPLVLILILGSAFSGYFGEPEINGRVLYYSEERSQLSLFLENQYHYLTNFTFTESENPEKGKKAVTEGNYDALIHIKKEDKSIEILYNTNSPLEKSILETFLRSALPQHSLVRLFQKKGMELPDFSRRKEFTEVKAPGKTNSPGALDYYGVTILTMILMLGAYVSSYGIRDEIKLGTMSRIRVAPVREYEFFLGVTLGSLFQMIIQAVIIILAGKYLLNINYGNKPVLLGLILLCQALMATGLGIFLVSAIKDMRTVDIFINASSQVLVFIAGGYFVLPATGLIGILSKISPVYWLNKGIFEVIYSDSYYFVKPAIIIPLILAAFFMILSSINFKKGVIQ